VAVALVSPIVLLHIVSFLFSSHDRSMKPFALRIVTDSSGHILRCCELKQSDAEWDILFIHRRPASAPAFGEQFRRPFPRQSRSPGPARFWCFQSGLPQAEPRRPDECRRPSAEKQIADNESAISVARNRVNTRFTKPTKRITLPWLWKSKSLSVP